MRTKTPLQAEKVLDAAARLFGTQRFHEVRMEDVAAEADVAKGTIYRYFEDKEELYLALLARSSSQFTAEVEGIVTGDDSARHRLEGVAATIITFFDHHPHLLDLIQRAEVMQRPGVEFPWEEARQRLFRAVTSLFEEGKERGEFTIRDPAMALLMFLGGLRSVIRFGPRPRPRDHARRVVAAFLHGSAAD